MLLVLARAKLPRGLEAEWLDRGWDRMEGRIVDEEVMEDAVTLETEFMNEGSVPTDPSEDSNCDSRMPLLLRAKRAREAAMLPIVVVATCLSSSGSEQRAYQRASRTGNEPCCPC